MKFAYFATITPALLAVLVGQVGAVTFPPGPESLPPSTTATIVKTPPAEASSTSTIIVSPSESASESTTISTSVTKPLSSSSTIAVTSTAPISDAPSTSVASTSSTGSAPSPSSGAAQAGLRVDGWVFGVCVGALAVFV